MQVQRIQNNQTSFHALKSFECSKSLKPIIGDAGEKIEQKLLKAFNEHKYFQELCKKNDVWVNIKPKHTNFIRSGLDVEIYATKLNETNIENRKNVINFTTVKFYGDPDYHSFLDESYRYHAEDIIQGFLKDVDGLKSGIRKFFEKSTPKTYM